MIMRDVLRVVDLTVVIGAVPTTPTTTGATKRPRIATAALSSNNSAIRPYSNDLSTTVRVEDGGLAEGWEYLDSSGAAAQLTLSTHRDRAVTESRD